MQKLAVVYSEQYRGPVVCLDSEGHLQLCGWLGSCPTTTPVPPQFIYHAINDATEHTTWIKHHLHFLFRFKTIKKKTQPSEERRIYQTIFLLCSAEWGS